MQVHVYILECADGSFYVGSTSNSLEARVTQHNTGAFGGYTSRRRPVRLVFAETFDTLQDAHAAERQLKGWRREKKLALINGDLEALRMLSKRPGARR